MILNWKNIVIGFLITLVLYVAGASLGHISILKGIIYIAAPLIGGFAVAYINNAVYIDGLINGGLASGMAGFAATLIIYGLEPVTTFGSYFGLLIAIIITQAVMAFVIGAVLGLLGGILGIIVKGQGFKEENLA